MVADFDGNRIRLVTLPNVVVLKIRCVLCGVKII